MQTLLQDIRYAVRVLKRAPGFTTVAVLAIALGIGANTMIFSSVDALLLRPFSFPNQERLVMMHERNLAIGIRRGSVSTGNVVEWSKRNRTFQEIVGMTRRNYDLTGGDRPERVESYHVTANFFNALGVQAALGRTFASEDGETGRDNVVVLKYDTWRQRFGADPGVIGKILTLNHKKYTVVGVMSREFDFPYGGAEMWTPLVFEQKDERDFGNHYLGMMGLLNPGVTIEQADVELRAISAQLEKEHPDTNSGRSVFVVGMTADFTRGARLFLPILIACVVFVLLIACANVANLLLARASARQKEIAVRLAVGANRSRIVRQLLTESVLLALLGGMTGLLLAVWGVEGLKGGIPDGMSKYIPGWNHLAVNRTVFLFTLIASVATGVLFGLAPALAATRTDFVETLKEGGKGAGRVTRNRLRSTLVVVEVALSLALLIGAGLMTRSFIEVMRTDFGFRPENVVTMHLALPDDRYTEAKQRIDFYRQLIERVEAMPAVTNAGAVNNLPMGGSSSSSNFQIVGDPPVPKALEPRVDVRVATTGYFDTVGTRLRKGRLFSDEDNEQTPRVALVNEAFAARFLPGRNALGQRVTIGGGEALEIVGVVSNIMNDDIDDPAEPGLYLPYLQRAQRGGLVLVVKSKSDPTHLVGAIRDRVAALDPNLPVSEIKTLQQAVDERLSPKRMMTWMMSIFGLMALVLAAVGLFAVMAYVVAQRTHEIGVRIALGAQRRDILRLVVGQGLLPVAIGSGLGLGLAFLMTRALAQILYGVTATDPATFIGIPALLTMVALAASYAPARRAMHVDPMTALRHE